MGGRGYGLLTEKSIKKFDKFLMWSSNLYFADQCNIMIITSEAYYILLCLSIQGECMLLLI